MYEGMQVAGDLGKHEVHFLFDTLTSDEEQLARTFKLLDDTRVSNLCDIKGKARTIRWNYALPFPAVLMPPGLMLQVWSASVSI